MGVKGLLCSEFFGACSKADGILVNSETPLAFIVGAKRTGKMRIIDEDEEMAIADEPLVLEFLWTLEDLDQHGFWATKEQVRNAKYLGNGVWSVEGYSEPDLSEPSADQFEIRLVRFESLER